MFQTLCNTYQKIVHDSEIKVFGGSVKGPPRRHKLRLNLNEQTGYQIHMANSQEEKQLFGILIVSSILNQPILVTEKLSRELL